MLKKTATSDLDTPPVAVYFRLSPYSPIKHNLLLDSESFIMDNLYVRNSLPGIYLYSLYNYTLKHFNLTHSRNYPKAKK